MKSVQTSREAAEPSLQTLLGTCKHNPLFSIQRDKAAECILLFYGAELLETFPDCPDHFAMKLCAGRLYNAGLKRSSLSEAFGMDIRTIARIARALCETDTGALVEVLQGRQRPRKMTPPIRSFIHEMMGMAFSMHPEAPSRFLREMVQNTFKVSLSPETIRPLLRAYRKEAKARETADTQTTCDPPEKSTEGITENIQAHDVANKQLNGLEPDPDPLESPEPDRKRSACFSPSCPPRSLPHAGLFVFLPMLEALAGVDHEDGALLRQWAAGVLLGAVNLEQTKTLDYASMETFLGPIRWKSPSPLRRELQRVSGREELRSSLLAFNARLTGHTAPTHVYFDPHTKLYTGKHPVLFGWISSANRWTRP